MFPVVLGKVSRAFRWIVACLIGIDTRRGGADLGSDWGYGNGQNHISTAPQYGYYLTKR